MKIKRITQSQHVKLNGFYSSHEAVTEDHKISLIRRILGITSHPEYSLKVLEQLFIERFVQHV